MRKLRLYLFGLLAASAMFAQTEVPPDLAAADQPTCDSTRKGRIIAFTDESSATDCDSTGGGSTVAVCYCTGSAWTALGGGASGDSAPYGELAFDNPPSTCALCDEFTGGAATLTYAWGNQGAGTVSLSNDMLYFNGGDTTNEWRGYCIDTGTHTLPGDADQTFCVKLSQLEIDTTNEHVGIAVIGTGTVASPTEIEVWGPGNFSTDSINASSYTAWSLTGSAGIATWPMGVDGLSRGSLWLRADFTATTNATDYYWSWDGKSWFSLGTPGNLTNGPISWCVGGRAFTHAYIDYVRLRTDANRAECGE